MWINKDTDIFFFLWLIEFNLLFNNQRNKANGNVDMKQPLNRKRESFEFFFNFLFYIGV